MVYLTGLYSDLRAIIAANWPDVPANGIWEDEHLLMIPWADLVPPYAVICINNAPVDDAEWGTANQVYAVTPHVYYVAEISGDSTPIRAKLETLRDALILASITNGQIIDVTELTWSEELEANKIFSAKEYTHRAGRLAVDVIVGVAK